MPKAVIKVTDLKEVVNKITALYYDLGAQVAGVSRNIIAIGECLTIAQKEVGYGKWLQWVSVNLPFGDREARRYMQIYDNREALGHLENPGINTALKLIGSASADQATVDAEVERQKTELTATHLKEAEKAIKAFEADQKKLLATIEELRKKGTGEDEVSAEITKLKNQRDVLMEDIKGLRDVEKSVSRVRDMFTKQLTAIPALNLTPRVVKATKPDVDALLDLIKNWSEAMKEIYNV